MKVNVKIIMFFLILIFFLIFVVYYLSKEDEILLKDSYYSEDFKELEQIYEEEFGALIVWIVPKDETLEKFSEITHLSIENGYDMIPDIYGREDEFIYWKDIISNIDFSEINEKLYKMPANDSAYAYEFSRLKEIYKRDRLSQFYIPENETLGGLEEKLMISQVGGYDILPPSYNWEDLTFHLWDSTREYEDLEKMFGEAGFQFNLFQMSGTWEALVDKVHKSIRKNKDYVTGKSNAEFFRLFFR